MSKCPKCGNRLPWTRTIKMFFAGNATVECPSCNVLLAQDKRKMVKFYIAAIGLASALGAALALGRFEQRTVLLVLLLWLIVTAFVFAKRVRLKYAGEN